MWARWRSIGLVMLAFVLVACGGDPAPPPQPPPSPSIEPEPAAWELLPAAESVGSWQDLVDVPGEPSEPVGEPAGEVTFADAAPRSATLSIDPCTLLDLGLFAEMVGAPVTGPIVLENGAACGVTDADDTARLALMVVPRGPEYRYLGEADRARAVAIDAPTTGWWLTGAPVPASDQLVVELDEGADLVVEVSFRRSASEADRRELAVDIAWEAVMRLPLDDPIGSFEEDQP